MDIITQAALGASVGGLVQGKKLGAKSMLIGAGLGILPDLDVIFIPLFDPLQKISIHRGYSHSLLFCVVASLFFAFLLRRFKWAQESTHKALFFLAFLCLFTHITLDTFTTYGTQWFLPFSDIRLSWDSITIIDPIFTLPILMGLFWSFRNFNKGAYNPVPNKLGLIIGTLYLLFTLAHKQSVINMFALNFKERNIPSDNMLTVPVSAGNLVWYGVGRNDTILYLGKYVPWTDNEIEFHSFPINDHLLDDHDPVLVDRLKWFAKDNYTVNQYEDKIRFYNLQVDMQGVRDIGEYLAPTAFYYEIERLPNRGYRLTSDVHPK